MTNFAKLKNMSVTELAEWLDEYGQFDGAPWNNWFNKSYCENCESIKLNYEDSKNKLGIEPLSLDLTCECAYCECNDHCRFFPNIEGIPDNKEVIELWLIEEAQNDSETVIELRKSAHD